ncbi:MAG: hypothetical protein IKC93_07945 [Candidatus Methanomethylophilaceae archaeon]|nr:hypothetical protein [Candidatus Methanomethylophilaceae archaeon]
MDKPIRRATMFLASLMVISIGVVFIVRAGMGNSPLTAMPYTSYLIITQMSFGNWTIIWSIIVIIIEKMLMRGNLGNVQLLMQLVMSFIFGYFVDFADLLLGDVAPANYAMQLMFLIIGCIVMGFGICLELKSDFTMLAADGLILAIHMKTKIPFGKVKLIIDVIWCVMSLVTGFLVLNDFAGTREGTILAAILVGPIIRCIQKRIPWLSHS